MTLFDAIEHGDLKTLRNLMRQGADLHQVDEESGAAPLALAAGSGHLPIVRLLLRAGADPDWGGAVTPLEAATLEGHVEVARVLIAAYADVNRPVADGFTPLITAASIGDLEMVETLLEAGAAVSVVDDEGESALSVAEKKGHSEVARVLAAAAGNGHRRRHNGDSVFAAIQDRDAERLREILAAGTADLVSCDRRGMTPLGRAAQTGHLALVRALLEGGALPDENGGRPPLVCAAESRHEPVVRTLLEAGAQVDATGGEERLTALMAAAAAGDPELVRLLLAKGADPKLRDQAEKDALWHAATAGQEQAFQLLAPAFSAAEREAAETELRKVVSERSEAATNAARLIDLVQAGQIDAAKRFLASGLTDPDGFDEEGRTALMIGASLGRRDLLRMLIAAGASFELVDDPNGWTALIYAVRSEAKSAHLTVSLLATAGADLNHADYEGATPLMHAVDVYLSRDEEDVSAFTSLANPLLHLGADVETEDVQGKTAWMRVRDRALDEETSVVERRKLARVRRVLEDAGALRTGSHRVEMLTAASEGQLGYLQDLLQSSTDEKVLEELPLLSVAASANNWDIVSFLVSLGLDINTSNRRGETILMQAASAGFLPIVEQLLQVGADPSLQSHEGKTAESFAAAGEHYEVVAVLRQAAKV